MAADQAAFFLTQKMAFFEKWLGNTLISNTY